ncbi:IscS subfamily cysteine desulfurase [Buchnera aphidicola]|uniref:Cysteine desulfurase IscS n=1 Tax=Buchnera aphidicola (Sarucallis kahawaluokalani) TaxID=1241878 RepID=A0A4D6YJP6_9GAMM|nr:IscS subfamily cysteine desulfurase [Buchnera aphidicola]QCI26184.1 IscS subfamily cysteine desulfurase [Buchnera aphidicola (Sarucallis kahawaluokalani)]
MKFPIYLDYASTTPVDKKVAKKMINYLTHDGTFGNPASRSHQFGWTAEEAVDIARDQIAELIHADAREIIFTSGATESNNLAIKGCCDFYRHKGKHIITSNTEHKSVLDTCRYLEQKKYSVTYINPKKNGIIDLNELEKNITKHTILVSIMYVNNETGTMQDIKKISNICRNKNVLLHVDATQAISTIPINLQKIHIDLMSFSAHKIYGPKGIGVLYIKRKPRVRLTPQIHGGSHERGMRSGTLPVHQIVGMGTACNLINKNLSYDTIKILKLRDILWNGIKNIEEIYLNTNLKHSAPHILNVSFNFVEGESLIMALKHLAVSSGSACTSASLEPSYVLKSLGLQDELAHSSIRFSIGRFTTQDEINYTINTIHHAIKKLRELSPLWEMFKDGIDLNKVKWQHN